MLLKPFKVVLWLLGWLGGSWLLSVHSPEASQCVAPWKFYVSEAFTGSGMSCGLRAALRALL